MDEQLYIIASLKHTNKHHEHITFWATNWRGYVIAMDERLGKYTEDDVNKGSLNDGESSIAVPEEALAALLSPQPFYADRKGVARAFYDIPGPVVDNTRANWNRLIAASLPRTGPKPKPEVFKGSRRSFALSTDERSSASTPLAGARKPKDLNPAAPAPLESGLVGVTMEPLSETRLLELREGRDELSGDAVDAFARAIEKAHGIAARAAPGEPT